MNIEIIEALADLEGEKALEVPAFWAGQVNKGLSDLEKVIESLENEIVSATKKAEQFKREYQRHSYKREIYRKELAETYLNAII